MDKSFTLENNKFKVAGRELVAKCGLSLTQVILLNEYWNVDRVAVDMIYLL